MLDDEKDDRDAARLLSTWRFSSDTAHRLFLLQLGVPFIANDPVEFAKNALTNLHGHELQDVLDWMSEQHWLQPGM